MMRASEYSWLRWEMSNKTMEEKRAHILKNAKLIAEESKFGYGSLESLKEVICYTMDWCEVFQGWTNASRKIWKVACKTEDQKVAKTIENMVAKGLIRISKSGKGFKVL